MSRLAEVIELGTEEEARRLWKGAEAAWDSSDENLISLCEFLDLGLHAAEILAVHLLQPLKDRFPATIGLQLALPTPEVNAERDGTHLPNVLQFTDLVDLLSAEDLKCISPGMHRGWEDRRFACRRSRVTAHEAIGVSLNEEEQHRLLVLAAYRTRIWRCSPPVRIVPQEIRPGFETLKNLVDQMLDKL